MSDFVSFSLAFFRLTIGFVFLLSFRGKIADIPAFQKTITEFNLLPKHLNNIAAILFLVGEGLVIIFLAIGGQFLIFGFLLALLLLVVFSLALALVLLRKIETPCNCFGASTKPIAPHDLLRNLGFILCALIGCILSNQGEYLSLPEWLIASGISATFVVLWLNLSDIHELLQA